MASKYVYTDKNLTNCYSYAGSPTGGRPNKIQVHNEDAAVGGARRRIRRPLQRTGAQGDATGSGWSHHVARVRIRLRIFAATV